MRLTLPGRFCVPAYRSADKIKLIEVLAETGLHHVQAASDRLAVDKARKSGSQLTLRWREAASNRRSLAQKRAGLSGVPTTE